MGMGVEVYRSELGAMAIRDLHTNQSFVQKP